MSNRDTIEGKAISYRCYFLKDSHIVAPYVIKASDDADALLQAQALLSKSPLSGIEVWQEKRLVGAFDNEAR